MEDNKELLENEEINEEHDELYTYDEVQDIIDNILPKIEIEKDKYFNNEKFRKGLDYGAFYAGIYTSLVNVGVLPSDAFQMLLNTQTCKHNIEVAKYQQASLEKSSI